MKNIVLTGFMGTGKTTVAAALCRQTGMKLIDTDEYIEKLTKMQIKEIFSKHGEQYFRSIETKCIKEISLQSKDCIISTGGGSVLNKENMTALKQNGVIINLSASIDEIIKRTSQSSNRPLLNSKTALQIQQLFDLRKQYYDDCDCKIDTDNLTVEQIVQKVWDFYKNNK